MAESPAGSRPHRSHLILPIVAIKVSIVALVVLLPSGLAIGLGVIHGIAAAVVIVALAVIVFIRRAKGRSEKK